MAPTSLIVVADRGGVKAYRVNDTPNRGANLQLVQAFEIIDAHGHYDEKLTDQAGRFAVSDGGAGRVTRKQLPLSRRKPIVASVSNWLSTSQKL